VAGDASRLEHVPLLACVPPSDLTVLAKNARRQRFDAGEVVFHEGDWGRSLHVIVEGRFSVRVQTDRGEAATLAVFGPNEIFGELALFQPSARRTATIVSLDRGETWSFDRDDFDAVRRRVPELTEALLTLVAQKVSRYTGQLLEALFVPAKTRVLRRLLEIASDDPEVRITQQQLAELAGTSRATVNDVLREERERGAIELSRNRLKIVDRERIERKAR
jgi:CRP-like cAMP-binding protein